MRDAASPRVHYAGAHVTDALWRRLVEIVPDVLPLPPADREAALDRACTDATGTLDAALRALAAHLVDAADTADAAGALASPLHGRGGDAQPDAIGPWRVTGVLGEGGMGVVYAAERVGDGFIQRAAVKRVRAAAGADFRARFLRERGLLAGLDHPGIARLLDGGVDASGAPFLAMERVDGAPITEAAEGRPLAGRLALVLQACDAVAYAHRNLVVHRDLKPDHIVVATDAAGASRVTLLDFGIAKLIGDADDALLTRTGAGPLTPQYAAPEQLLGQPITTATDVYALGLVLYEVLAGQRPYSLAGVTAAEAERLVCHADPPVLSSVAPAERARALRGDLDTIVAKALSKVPAHRYASAETLAADLRRHLGGLPIDARPASRAYRARLFVRRHRTGVVATVAIAVALVAGLVGTAWQARTAAAARDRAQDEADKATAVSEFLRATLLSAGPSVGDAVRPSELRVVDVLRPAAAHAQTAFPGRPDVRAAVLSTLGRTYYDLGLWREAEGASRAALAIRDSLHGATPHEDRIQSIEEIARLDGRRGHGAAAVAGYRRALRLRAERYGPRSVEVVRGLWLYADILEAFDHTDAAFRAARRALALARGIAGDASLEASQALHVLAILQFQHDQVPQADSALTVLVARARPYFGPDAPELAMLLHHLAVVKIFQQDYAAAAPLIDEALRIREARFDATHPVLNESRSILAGLLIERGQPREAEAIMRSTLGTFRAGLDNPDPFERHLAEAELGAALAGQRRFEEAEALLRPNVAWLRRHLGARHGWTRHEARHLADLYEAAGRPGDARPYRALADAPAAPRR